jgi:purine-nucleoside phosphorylase
MMDLEKARLASEFVLKQTPLRPRVALVLGSGLGSFADEFTEAARISFSDIPNFPRSTADGHAGKLVVGRADGIPVAAMQGRVHYYEGYDMKQVVFPIRVLWAMGVRAIILTNAAGGISEGLEQGCLVVLSDHINLQGTNPLIGPNDPRMGLRYPDMTAAYDPAYRRWAVAAGQKVGVPIHEGVYIAVSGPCYETPAEIRAFTALGADVVGMSTVPEVIVARHLSMKVLAISCITNLAAGRNAEPLSHEEVMQTGIAVRSKFLALLKEVIPQLDQDVAT